LKSVTAQEGVKKMDINDIVKLQFDIDVLKITPNDIDFLIELLTIIKNRPSQPKKEGE
jgi:hypothetical protein